MLARPAYYAHLAAYMNLLVVADFRCWMRGMIAAKEASKILKLDRSVPLNVNYVVIYSL